MQRLTPKQLKEYREAQWLAQGKRCALTGYTISLDQAVVDHDHATGRIRGVLHRGVNSLLGKIENSYRRFGVSLPMVTAMTAGIQEYLARDQGCSPVYPKHRTEEEKRERRNKLAREARAKKKAAL